MIYAHMSNAPKFTNKKAELRLTNSPDLSTWNADDIEGNRSRQWFDTKKQCRDYCKSIGAIPHNF